MAAKTIRVLCLGDLVGRPGRRVIRECLTQVKADHRIDFTIVNVENATNGAGLRVKEGEELLSYGIDCMTSGDHILDFPESFDYAEREYRLLRPVNYEMKGRGAWIFSAGEGVRVGVVNAAGQVFMKERCKTENAFPATLEAVEKLREETPIVFVDIHAEATSEKIAMGWYLDGKASAVFGSHTHVQTADLQILPGGTGYMTDLGMTGPHHGVIGRDVEAVLKRFTTDERTYMKVAKDWVRMTGAIFEIDVKTGKCVGTKLFSHTLETTSEEATSD
ncbi:MAG: TIGR00282 family metallophosphoesterase [Planctomycetota bacterium]